MDMLDLKVKKGIFRKSLEALLIMLLFRMWNPDMQLNQRRLLLRNL